MKQIITNYSFSTSGKSITLSDFGSSHPVDLKRLYLITDVTTNKILYNFADNTVATAVVSSNNVVTLSALQGGESNSDALQIIYDIVVGDPAYELPQTELTDGTNVANVMTPGTANSSGNAILVGPTSYTQAFSYTAITNGPTFDVGNYKTVSVHINTQYNSSTVTFQTSNDGVNWVALALASTASTISQASTSSTSTGALYEGTIRGRYFRLSVTGTYSSGTCAGVIVFSTGSSSPVSVGATTTPSGGGVSIGTITSSASSLISTTTSNLGGMALISIHGTYAGVSFGISVSDDAQSTFYNVPIYDVAAEAWLAPGATISPGANASKNYWVTVSPVSTAVKVLASAYTSGTANLRIAYGYGTNPPSSMSQIMDAAGNARGVNVNASNQMSVIDGATALTGAAVPFAASLIGGNLGGNLTAPTMTAGTTDNVSSGNSLYTAANGYTFNGATWDRSRSGGVTGMAGVVTQASPSGGATPVHYISASGTNATTTKASAGSIYNIECFNNSTTIAYLKLYDKATAPTVGTDTPVKVILIPANANGAGAVRSPAIPTKFSNGISWALTGGIADTDATSVAANQLIVNFDYI
jgi:hypothetical protein